MRPGPPTAAAAPSAAAAAAAPATAAAPAAAAAPTAAAASSPGAGAMGGLDAGGRLVLREPALLHVSGPEILPPPPCAESRAEAVRGSCSGGGTRARCAPWPGELGPANPAQGGGHGVPLGFHEPPPLYLAAPPPPRSLTRPLNSRGVGGAEGEVGGGGARGVGRTVPCLWQTTSTE